MTKPLVVSIPHQLGKQEARRRLQSGIEQVKAAYANKFVILDERWTGDSLDFGLSVMSQTIAGHLDVADDNVTLSLQLPWILAFIAEKAKGMIQSQGHLMLEKK